MQVLGSRRGGLITLSIAAVALVAAVAFAVGSSSSGLR